MSTQMGNVESAMKLKSQGRTSSYHCIAGPETVIGDARGVAEGVGYHSTKKNRGKSGTIKAEWRLVHAKEEMTGRVRLSFSKNFIGGRYCREMRGGRSGKADCRQEFAHVREKRILIEKLCTIKSSRRPGEELYKTLGNNLPRRGRGGTACERSEGTLHHKKKRNASNQSILSCAMVPQSKGIDFGKKGWPSGPEWKGGGTTRVSNEVAKVCLQGSEEGSEATDL